VWGTPFALVAVALGLLAAAPAAASPVLEVGDGTSVLRDDPFVPAGQDLPPGGVGRAPAVTPPGRATAAAKKKPTVDSELRRFKKSRGITKAQYEAYDASYKRAKRARRGLTGQRGNELGAVISNLDWLASVDRLEPSRLPALFLTLDRNRQLWATRAELPLSRGKVVFEGSEIVWVYYVGQGLQINALNTFGTANGLWTAGEDARLAKLFEEMLPLMAKRGSAVAWEYYFFFGGGRPPWTSAMAQATGLEALARASNRLQKPEWRSVFPSALKLFEIAPPTGVRIDTPAGRHYLQYSFTPGTRIINAFMQSVIGLYETASQLNDPTALKLAQLGDAQAKAELPLYDTGAWTLYAQGGEEADIDYYRLAYSFLKRLCKTVSKAPEYCAAFDTWTGYLKTPPQTRLLTTTAVAKKRTNLRFRLDKVSNVGVAIDDPSGKNVLFKQGQYGHGTRAVLFTPPRAGTYAVRIEAVDLNDNKNETSWTLEVAPAPKKPPAR
jgi:hypothetical protein